MYRVRFPRGARRHPVRVLPTDRTPARLSYRSGLHQTADTRAGGKAAQTDAKGRVDSGRIMGCHMDIMDIKKVAAE